MLLPSLIELSIGDFLNLECLSCKGLRNLVSLESLNLISCPMLASFPDDGLPLSLLYLEIYNYPQLQQRCLKDKGQEWSKISRISLVTMQCKKSLIQGAPFLKFGCIISSTFSE